VTLSSHNTNTELTHFKRCLIAIEQDVLRMGTLVEEVFRLSHQALCDRNLEAAAKIPDIDDTIDRYYHQIERDCATLMTLQAPVAQDLRLLIAFMQLVRDLERIGDYAENIAEIAIKLFPYKPHPCMKKIAMMSNHAQLMLATSLVSLAELDANAGAKVKQLDDTVDDAYDDIYAILAGTKNIKGSIEPFIILGLAIRYLERTADRATNIAKRVSYIVTGDR
jgi:phosphate transport system protein